MIAITHVVYSYVPLKPTCKDECKHCCYQATNVEIKLFYLITIHFLSGLVIKLTSVVKKSQTFNFVNYALHIDSKCHTVF